MYQGTYSPLHPQGRDTGINFAATKTVQAKNIRVTGLVGTTHIAGGLGTVVNQGALTFYFVQTPVVRKNMSHAYPHVALYLGTKQDPNKQLYPGFGTTYILAGSTNNWYFWSGFDYETWNSGFYTGGTQQAQANIYAVTALNVSGATGTIFATSNWKYINNNAGTSSAA